MKNVYYSKSGFEKNQTQFLQACLSGDLECVKHYLSQQLPSNCLLSNNDYSAFFCAVTSNNITLVKYLLTEVYEKPSIHIKDDKLWLDACTNYKKEIIDFLCFDKDLDEHINVRVQNNKGFFIACVNNHVELLQFMLESPLLTEHTLLNEVQQKALDLCILHGSQECIEYLSTKTDLQSLMFNSHNLLEYLSNKAYVEGEGKSFVDYLLHNFKITFSDKELNELITKTFYDWNKKYNKIFVEMVKAKKVHDNLSEKLSKKTSHKNIKV